MAINLASGSAATTFEIVLTIAISTVLLSYLIIYPSGVRLRRLYPDVHRPFVVPGGNAGLWICTVLACAFPIQGGSWLLRDDVGRGGKDVRIRPVGQPPA